VRQKAPVQTAEKAVALGDTSIVHSYGYELVGITQRSSIFDSLPSKPSAAQTPSGFPHRGIKIKRYHWRMPQYQFSVQVQPAYLADQSAPEQGVYTFAYTVTITNTGEVTAQLISRSWNINDADGRNDKVKGLGVVGEQPLLKPGESFEYTSGCRLRTPTGTMHGSYFCVAEDGEKFDADIPMFVLDALSALGGKPTMH
jgi:ApaG protein